MGPARYSTKLSTQPEGIKKNRAQRRKTLLPEGSSATPKGIIQHPPVRYRKKPRRVSFNNPREVSKETPKAWKRAQARSLLGFTTSWAKPFSFIGICWYTFKRPRNSMLLLGKYTVTLDPMENPLDQEATVSHCTSNSMLLRFPLPGQSPLRLLVYVCIPINV